MAQMSNSKTMADLKTQSPTSMNESMEISVRRNESSSVLDKVIVNDGGAANRS